MSILINNNDFLNTNAYSEWLNSDRAKQLSELDYEIVPLTKQHANLPFKNGKVSWTVKDFLHDNDTSGRQAFSLLLRGKSDVLLAVFTLEYPANNKCKGIDECLKLEAIMKNSGLEKNKIIIGIIQSLDCLALLLGLKCVQLDAVENLFKNKYYHKVGYKKCGNPYNSTEDGKLYPMRKKAYCQNQSNDEER